MSQINKNIVAIFCFYDERGLVDSDTLYLIAELKKVCTYICMVVNGNYIKNEKCEELVDQILERENNGFDAAAYKYALSMEEVKHKVQESDGLVLCNNSFWGPFVGFEQILNKMEEDERDYYGITRLKVNLAEHINSYFIIFNKKIVLDKLFWDFFSKKISYTFDYREVCACFENGLYRYLKELGYVPGAYIDAISCNLYKNPYGSLSIDKVPILKKKIFSTQYFDYANCISALKYIVDKYDYDFDSIIRYGRHKGYEVTLREIVRSEYVHSDRDIYPSLKVTRESALRFIERHSEVYIYGTGVHGRKVFEQLFSFQNERKLKGFIVSDNITIDADSLYGYPVIHLKEAKANTAILVGLCGNSLDEVKESILDRDCLFIWEK